MTTIHRLFFRIFTVVQIAGFSIAVAAQAPSQSTVVFPMEKGTTWTYSARVKWSGVGSSAGGVKTLLWTSAVIDSYRHGDVEAALVHGGPWDLAWYSPSETKPKDYLVIRAADSYYLVHDEDARTQFSEMKTSTAEEIAAKFADDVWFRVPLEINDSFCAPDQEKTAPFYCWSVEKVTTTHSLRFPGFSPRVATEYFLAFMTNPDTTTLTLVPGAGIITYEYEHHGTVAEASVKLVRFRAGKGATSGVTRRRRASKHVR